MSSPIPAAAVPARAFDAGRWPTVLREVPAAPNIARPRLLRRLAGARDARVVLVRAPAGYGKSVLLEAWMQADGRAFASVSADAATRLEGRWPVELAERARALGRGLVVVIDDVGPAHWQAVAALARDVPPGSLLAIATRGAPRLRLARLRAERRVVEIGARDLAMTRGEAAALLGACGTPLGPAAIDALVRRTEGWPAALSLAALAVGEARDHDAAAMRFGGDDALVGDYLREEVLAELPAGQRRVLERTCVLDELTGELCDAVLDGNGAGALLRDLARSDVPVVAVDRAETRFRCHPLLREALCADLRRRDPAGAAVIHGRAARWMADRGDTHAAIEHALAAEDLDLLAALLGGAAAACAFDGRTATLDGWLARLPRHHVEARAPLALAAATAAFARADRAAVERWTRVTETGDPALAAAAAALRAGFDGPAAMRAAAGRLVSVTAPGSPWRALGALLHGAAALLDAEAGDGARAALEDGARRGALPTPALAALCEAQLAFAALVAGDDAAGDRLAQRAHAHAHAAGPVAGRLLALVPAVGALAHAQAGRVDRARADAVRARELLAGAEDGVLPWCDAQALVALVRAGVRMGTVSDADALLDRAACCAAELPATPALTSWLADARERVAAFTRDAADAPALTTAELRVLRHLPSHRSFREIAEALHVSSNTIKTQAHAIYRKLDASSRSEAVARATALGLLGASAGV